MRRDSNKIIEAAVVKSDITFERIKIANHWSLLKKGVCVIFLLRPGTVRAAANTTVEIRVATSIHELDVSFIASFPTLSKSLCVLLNISLGVSPLEFFLFLSEGRTIFFTSYNDRDI